MKLTILLYACGFSSFLIGMDNKDTKKKLFGEIIILIAMFINGLAMVLKTI